jgi:N-acetylmuramoyl-L-alanine amidase
MNHITPSPNHNARTKEVKLIVLHADASPNEKGTLDWLRRSESKVSYHVLIGRKGDIYRCVPGDRRAWHAGKSDWQGEKDVNAISLGLAFANKNDGKEPLTDAQKTAAKQVIAEWREKYGPIPVTTHAKVAPGRKSDPESCPNFALADFA